MQVKTHVLIFGLDCTFDSSAPLPEPALLALEVLEFSSEW